MARGLALAIDAAVPESVRYLVDGFGIVGAYALLFEGFDRWGWRWSMWRMAGVVVWPDFSGRWVGELWSSHEGEAGGSLNRPVAVEIVQRFSGLTISAYFEQSKSTSRLASLLEEADGSWAAHYAYWNESRTEAPTSMRSHAGAGRLWLSGLQQLEGDYFNSARDARGHFGTMRVKYASTKLSRGLA